MRRHPLATAALMSAAVLMVPAAPALAAGHGHGHQPGQHQNTAHGHAEHAQAATAHGHAAHGHAASSHLARQLHGAEHAVANQLRQVNRLADLVATSDKISDVDRAAVTGALQADVDALTTLQSQLAAAASHHDVVSAVHQGILVRAVARTQTTVAEQAGAVRAAAGSATTTDPTDPTATDPTATDPTATDPTATDPTSGTVASDADAAMAAVVALAPESTRAQIHQARQTAEAALADADTALGTSTETDDSGDSTSGSSTPTA